MVRERGYEAMTYDAVAERAGVSRRTVFNYFPTKFDLIKVWPALDPEAFAHIASTSNNFLADLRELLLERARRLTVTVRNFCCCARLPPLIRKFTTV